MTIIKRFLDLLGRKKARQIGSLYSTMIVGMVIGVGNSIINTRLLGPQQYGDFKFLIQLFTFVVMFLTLGHFYSGSRMLAQEENKDDVPRIKGTMMLLAAVVSGLMIVGFFIFSFFEEKIYDNNLGAVIRMFSPFLFIYPFKVCMENIMIGSNEIHKLSVFRLFPPAVYLGAALAVNLFLPLSLTTALLINLSSFAVIIVIMMVKLKPSFKSLKPLWPRLREENRRLGFPVYISSLANTATARVAALTIAFFMDNVNVGYYALAITITEPLSIIPRVVGVTFFKDFANRDTLPLKATAATIGLAGAALLMFLLLIKTLFFIIYPRDFAPALSVVYFFAFSAVIQGFADYVNRFLGAHGRGKDMRNSGFIVAVSNIAGYTVLVKFLRLEGAVITRVAAAFIYLAAMLYYYKRFTTKNTKDTKNIEKKIKGET